MKNLILLVLCIPWSLSAQYFGGTADGEARSTTIQLDLGGVPGGVRGLYAGGSNDGYAGSRAFTGLNPGSSGALYGGGSGDGHDRNSASTTISGNDLSLIYGGGSGDGYNFRQGSQSLDGQSLDGLYGGGTGDGFDRLQTSAALDGQVLQGWYGGGGGDGHHLAVSSGTLGEMLMLYGGGSGDGFDRKSAAFSLSGPSLQSLYSGGSGDGAASTNFSGVVPLPLTLVSFDAFPEETYVLLRWVTEDEVNTDYFTIEKTRTGRAFEWVGEELAAGFSLPEEKLHYEMKDEKPYPGTSFYRLKTTDFDGLVSYSHLVEVNYDQLADWSFNLYPNPNTGRHFNIQTSGLIDESKLLLEVFDLQGRLIQQAPLFATDFQAVQVQLRQQLAAGSYLIRLHHQELGQQSKILIVGER